MKITYTVPVDHSVRSIEGSTLAAEQVVKTILKNLKRWYVRLRRGRTSRAVNFDRQNHPNEITVSRHARTTMMIDQEESRNRANENLENELREHLANNEAVVDDDSDRYSWTEDNGPPVKDLPRDAGVLRGVTRR